MKYNLVSSWLLIILLFLSCNNSIENSTNSKQTSENLIVELIDIEEKLTQVNPNNTGEVLKISNQIESLAMKLFTQKRNDLDTVSLEFVFECLAKTAEIHRDYNRSIDFFKRAQQLNPKSIKAPAYLHNIARIYDHVLIDVEKALSAYEELIKKYPNHPLSINAKLYLDNAFNRSDEELLNMIKENNP
tara:strand:+ start:1975 stop:2538 length:564 start_codon:yes stop_codon:yes gene_type:complete